MKVTKLVVENVTSYKQRTQFDFDRHLNILIGPNGGGKSNLQKILAVVLTKFFVQQYQVRNEQDQSHLELVDPYTKRILQSVLGTFNQQGGDQEIIVEFQVDSSDIKNIESIVQHLEELNKALIERFYYPVKEFISESLIKKLREAGPISYTIRNHDLVSPVENSAEAAFLAYLRQFFVFFRVAPLVAGVKLTAPIFFFSSDRALTRSFDIQVGNLTEENYQNGIRSALNAATGQTSLMEWGAQHFARLYRRASNRAGKTAGKVYRDYLMAEEDVKLLEKYLGKLGYKWSLHFEDDDETRYQFALRKGDIYKTAAGFSSGEREIVHFLLAMFALNVRDGLVLVDEPELHLHPRWQRIFLILFRELAPDRNNQFLIATHSPVFVSPETIHCIIRIYQPDDQGSKKVELRNVNLPAEKHLVRMINSHNNERMFFADRVVLVEGPSDRLVIGSLLDRFTEKYGINDAVEVIEVGGKHNFKGYQTLMKALDTPCTVVADMDFLEQVGRANVRSLFRTDGRSQANSLLDDKKSTDRSALVRSIRNCVEKGKKSELVDFLDYLDTRHRKLRTGLSRVERRSLAEEFIRLQSNGIEVLRHGEGEIEDYLPGRMSDLGNIAELVSNVEWQNRIEDPVRRRYLVLLAARLAGINLTNLQEIGRRAASGLPLFGLRRPKGRKKASSIAGTV